MGNFKEQEKSLRLRVFNIQRDQNIVTKIMKIILKAHNTISRHFRIGT